MSTAVSDSAKAVPHSRIRELAEIAMTMDNVLKLYFGESNLPTPDFIKRAADKELRDGFTYYENTGTRTKPVYAAGRPLTSAGVPVRMDLCMITPTAVDRILP